jgi:hypothetical protein
LTSGFQANNVVMAAALPLGEFEQLVLLVRALRASRATLLRLWAGLEAALGEAE